MNLKLKTKKNLAVCVAAAMLSLSPATMFANDDFGVWTSLQASKKLTEKLKVEFEGELRTIDGVSETDRRSLGVSMNYAILPWLKADIGYIYIKSFNQEKTSIKSDAKYNPDNSVVYNYNVDHSYWEERDRLFVSLIANWKVGRVKFTLRERLQYQYTHSALTYEDKYRYKIIDNTNPDAHFVLVDKDEKDNEGKPYSDAEVKDSKRSTLLRSRLTAKWDIKKCKLAPFASVELFTRTDEWRGHDKLRYRIGADYKIDKDNEVSLYYMYQDNHSSSSPAGHAVCVGYSFDL